MTGVVKLVVRIILVLGVIGGGYWGYTSYFTPQAPEVIVTTPPVKVVTPRLGTLRETITLGGYAAAKKEVTVLPQVSGQLSSLYAEEGMEVYTGDLLAVIDKRLYRLRLDQAESSYRAASSNFERVEKLYEKGAATQLHYDQARAQYEAAHSQYEQANIQLSYTNIIAPVAGTVLITHTTEGSLVGPEVPIATISDLDRQEISFYVPEVYYDLFRRSRNEIRVSIKRPGDAHEASRGTITRVASHIDPRSRSFEAVSSVENPEELRPGMYVEVTCLLAEYPNEYILPYACLTAGGNIWYVDPDTSTAHRLRVTPRVETDEGFSTAEQHADLLVISEGQHFLQDGQEVTYSRDESQRSELGL
ncbi:MAG: efflux RND transporter periplasmic adaptor subunit [Spirochaetota bacterium]